MIRGSATGSAASVLVQGTCVLIGRTAVLIRGRPGSGKSSLAAGLLHQTCSRRCIRLVADDAVHLRPASGRLIAVCPAPISGLLELRGVGPVAIAETDRAVVSAVVDLVAADRVDRLPEPDFTRLLCIELPRLALPERGQLNAALLLAWFDRLAPGQGSVRHLAGAASLHHSIRA